MECDVALWDTVSPEVCSDCIQTQMSYAEVCVLNACVSSSAVSAGEPVCGQTVVTETPC